MEIISSPVVLLNDEAELIRMNCKALDHERSSAK